MFNLIDRYIAKKWITTFIGSLTIFLLLITVLEIINGFLRGKYIGLGLILSQYIIKLPLFLSKIIPTCCLLASALSINHLKSTSELTAVNSTGFSRFQLLRIVGTLSGIVALSLFLLSSEIEPKIYKLTPKLLGKKEAAKKGKFLARSSISGGKMWFKNQSYFAAFTAFNKEKMTLQNIEIFKLNDHKFFKKIIKANKAQYLQEKTWVLYDGNEMNQLEKDSFPLIQSFKKKQFQLEEQPKDFKNFESDIKTLGFKDLNRFIHKLNGTGVDIREYEQMFYGKISHALMCLIFAFFPLLASLDLNTRHASLGKNLGLALLTSIILWGVYIGFTSLGQQAIIPVATANMGAILILLTYFSIRFSR